MLSFSCFCLFILISYIQANTDPCLISNYALLRDPEGVSSSGVPVPRPVNSDELLCHRLTLEAGWYRFESPAGNDMPTECVELFHCNTRYPIWLKDPIPPADGKIHTLKGMFTSRTCATINDANSITVKVKNCSKYRVYGLTPPPTCPAAYCIGTESPCTNGTRSESGFTPGCKSIASSGNVTWNQEGTVYVEKGGQVNVTCTLDEVTAVSVWHITKVARGTHNDNLTITTNTVWGDDFYKSSDKVRYTKNYEYDENTKLVTLQLTINGTKPLDSGVYRCWQVEGNQDNVTVEVRTPVDQVDFGTSNANGTFTAQQGILHLGHDNVTSLDNMTSIACQAWRVGTEYPILSLTVDGKDETLLFKLSHHREPHGIGVKSYSRLTYSSLEPPYSFNGKVFMCRASVPASQQARDATIKLNITNSPPFLMCAKKQYYAPLGNKVDILCDVYGNPRPDIRWYGGTNNVYNSPQPYPKDGITTHENLHGNKLEVKLSINKVEDKHYKAYTLQASNSFKTETIVFTLSKGRTNEGSGAATLVPTNLVLLLVTMLTMFK